MEGGGFSAFAKINDIFSGHKQIVLLFYILFARPRRALGHVPILPQRKGQYLFFFIP